MALWSRCHFFSYIVAAVLLIIASIGALIGNAGLATCGKSLGCCQCIFTLVLMILGAIWRWGADGTLASCYKLKCGLTEETVQGSGYQYKAGKLMNILLWIQYVVIGLPCACCLLCIPLLCLCAICGKKD